VLDLSIQDRSLLCIKPHTPSLFPITSNCFSSDHRWILNSIPAIRIPVGWLGAECNILNPYEMGKYPLARFISGSRLENRITCSVVLLKWVCVIDSNRISYRAIEDILWNIVSQTLYWNFGTLIADRQHIFDWCQRTSDSLFRNFCVSHLSPKYYEQNGFITKNR
jgi:hypothetical protein